ncbi:hypothetical protein HYDPIDRAFT_100892 [Hydnomerulius pinastri MD-312]|uniref:WD40 repeat-like protein n=1 Tax=Hydnomerulius pinastri MD-312 TaxID=994086 RepID=A0A0C9W933_9AGAM|nr:hypothetical protein HYDPIDRAFT_100892 [Hydnomerulius pinastri MD-312]
MVSSPSGSPTPSSKPSNEAPGPSSQTPLKVLEGHSNRVKGVAFFPYDRRLLSASHDGTIIIWDVESGEVEKKVTDHTERVNSIAIAPDGSIFASGSDGGMLRFWHGLTGEPGEPPSATGFKGGEVWGISFSPDGLRITATGGDYVQIWDTHTREPIAVPLEVPSGGYYTTAFSPDGSRIAADAADGTIRVWDSVSGEVVFESLKGHSSTVRCAVFTPDGEQLVTCAEDNTIRRWDMESGELLGTPLEGHTDTPYRVVPSPNGKILASSGADHTVRFWDLKTGDSKPTFLQLDDKVFAVAFSSDGRLLAVACHDTKVYIWDMKAIEAGWCTPLTCVRHLIFLLQNLKMIATHSWMSVLFLSPSVGPSSRLLQLPATIPFGRSEDVVEVNQHDVDPLDVNTKICSVSQTTNTH